jgi:triosephosphate isomerase (TIM)
MRRPIVAGNWKMNTTLAEAVELVQALRPGLETITTVDRVVCPPFISLAAVAELLADSGVAVGAQNVYPEKSGAYTGETSPPMLQGLAEYVILGHSERRQYFGETDELVGRKVAAALAHGLKPIVCVGENLEQNEGGQTATVVTSQVRAALAGITIAESAGLVIAYEPIWAIGTGRAATGEGANEVIGLIRRTAAEILGPPAATDLRIQYGGSVTPDTFPALISQPEIDGARVGGASLRAPLFIEICRQAATG